jgi:hypothetical protein
MLDLTKPFKTIPALLMPLSRGTINTASSDPPTISPPKPFAIGNIRSFLAFRLLFGVRFYYPVFAVLFLDFGLSVGRFAALNAVWAEG